MLDIVSSLYIFFGGIFGIICISFCCKKYIEDRQIIGINQNNIPNYYNQPAILQLDDYNRNIIRYLDMNPDITPRLTHKPYEMVDNIDSDKECIICMDKIDGQECRLNCGHGYHYDCIKEWAYDRQNNSCPQCRGAIIDYIV